MKKLPSKTIERLTQYRRILMHCLEGNCLSKGIKNVYSYELASLMHINPSHVRRDLMLLGLSGSKNKGYNIQYLTDSIGNVLNINKQKISIIGIGNLGRFFINYFNSSKQTNFFIVAAFDNNIKKINKTILGIPCYDINELSKIIEKENISICILTVPPVAAKKIADILVNTKIKGILNYTTIPLKIPSNIHLEEYDIITSLEKTSYFLSNML
jgi:redox-sensing transcriptional repressor